MQNYVKLFHNIQKYTGIYRNTRKYAKHAKYSTCYNI